MGFEPGMEWGSERGRKINTACGEPRPLSSEFKLEKTMKIPMLNRDRFLSGQLGLDPRC